MTYLYKISSILNAFFGLDCNLPTCTNDYQTKVKNWYNSVMFKWSGKLSNGKKKLFHKIVMKITHI